MFLTYFQGVVPYICWQFIFFNRDQMCWIKFKVMPIKINPYIVSKKTKCSLNKVIARSWAFLISCQYICWLQWLKSSLIPNSQCLGAVFLKCTKRLWFCETFVSSLRNKVTFWNKINTLSCDTTLKKVKTYQRVISFSKK